MRSSSGPRLLTPADVRRLLDAHGLAPRKAAGQNFVVDPNTVRKIVRDAGVGADDVVLEIGPGLGSLTLALAARVEVVAAVPRSVFLPVPNVDSVTVRILRREDAYSPQERTAISAVIDAAFAQRRKTLRNALRRLADPERLSVALAAAGVQSGARAEELAVEDFARLAGALSDATQGGVASQGFVR